MVQIQFTTSAQRLESPAQSYTRRQTTAHAGGAMVAAESTFLCRNFSIEKGQFPVEPKKRFCLFVVGPFHLIKRDFSPEAHLPFPELNSG